jgi:hypothetical protein
VKGVLSTKLAIKLRHCLCSKSESLCALPVANAPQIANANAKSILPPPTSRITHRPIPQTTIAPLRLTPASHMQTPLCPLNHLTTFWTSLPPLLLRQRLDRFPILIFFANPLMFFSTTCNARFGFAGLTCCYRAVDMLGWDEAVTRWGRAVFWFSCREFEDHE